MSRMRNHWNLGTEDGSYALLSRQENIDTAIVFVHGLEGSPTGTWLDFQSLVDELEQFEPMFSTSDLYFYGYDSRHGKVAVHTSRLNDFIENVYPDADFPSSVIMSRAMRQFIPVPDDADKGLRRSYSRLFLVGHSLGAVLIRSVIANECRDYDNHLANPHLGYLSPPEVIDSELRLFAPAIFGFKPEGPKGFLYAFCLEHPKLKPYAKAALQAFVPVHEDLKEGASLLEALKKTTEGLSRKHPEWSCFRARTIFGTAEEYLRMDRYECDATLEFADGQDHGSVCKPSAAYLKPLEFVAYGLFRPATA